MPACAATADLVLEIENRSSSAVGAFVRGRLVDEAGTCTGPVELTYPETEVMCAARSTCTHRIPGLRPGDWLHRLEVQVRDSDQQRQSQRRVLAAGPGGGANRVKWIVYPRAYLVSGGAGGLVAALDRATAYLAGDDHPPGAIVTFDWGPGRPGACDPAEIVIGNSHPCLEGAGCSSRDAAYCLGATGLVLDALDPNGEPGGIVLRSSVDEVLLRICGSANVIRGLRLAGDPDFCPGQQRDTVVIDGAAADNRLEDLLIDGPGRGDALGAQGGGDGNVVVRAEIRGAQDKGVKVTDGAHLLITDSCVAENRAGGGIQATRGGAVTALRNVVQLNLPGGAQNGIWARGWPLGGSGEIEDPSRVRTDANVVRFNGGRGLSATDDAIALFRNDYVANNQYAGARIESTAPCSMFGTMTRFDGVGLVCNASTTSAGGPRLSGTCRVTRASCCVDADCQESDVCQGGTCRDTRRSCRVGEVGEMGCPLPDLCQGTPPRGLGLGIEYGAGEFGCCGTCGRPPAGACSDCGTSCAGACLSPEVDLGAGRNAFVGQPVRAGDRAGQLVAGAGVLPVDAHGNLWDDCTTADCRPASVTGPVDTAPAAVGSALDPVRIVAVWPSRPARGDLVRIWGEGFDAIAGNRVPECALTTSPEDACDPSNAAVTALNRAGAINQVSLRLFGQDIAADVVAVTPSMLAFRMPVDCFAADGALVVRRAQVESAAWPLCATAGDCLGVEDGAPCEPDGLPCTGDVCRAGACTHEPVPAGTPCRPAFGVCDVAETCDGASGDCPAEVLAPAGGVCRPAADECDVADACDGEQAACPADARRPACPPESTTSTLATTTTTSSTATTSMPASTTTSSTTSTSLAASTTSTTSTSLATSTTTTSLAVSASTTTTTLPCSDPGTALTGVLEAAACAGRPVPRPIRKRLRSAASLIERATREPEKAARLRRKAAKHLTRAIKSAERAGARRRPRISPQCALAIGTAAGGARQCIRP